MKTSTYLLIMVAMIVPVMGYILISGGGAPEASLWSLSNLDVTENGEFVLNVWESVAERVSSVPLQVRAFHLNEGVGRSFDDLMVVTNRGIISESDPRMVALGYRPERHMDHRYFEGQGFQTEQWGAISIEAKYPFVSVQSSDTESPKMVVYTSRLGATVLTLYAPYSGTYTFRAFEAERPFDHVPGSISVRFLDRNANTLQEFDLSDGDPYAYRGRAKSIWDVEAGDVLLYLVIDGEFDADVVLVDCDIVFNRE